MGDKKITITTGTPGLCSMLFITFLVLKLTNVINWSWWWITAPLWIPFGLGIFIVFLVFVVGLIWAGCENSSHKRYYR